MSKETRSTETKLFRRFLGPELAVSDLEKRLKGTRGGNVVQEFLTNSFYFPLANIILEFLIEGTFEFLEEPDVYIILFAASVQAFFLGTWQFKERFRPLIGNLIGPSVYTMFELILEGGDFFAGPQHLAYWGFSLAIGVLQQLRLRFGGRAFVFLILAENVVRTSILLVMYWIFEVILDPGMASMGEFFSAKDHVFITIVIPLLGLMIGIANVSAANYLGILRRTASQLKVYSEWFLGKDLLSKAVNDHGTLALQSQTRAVLFMDIRGFTAWSEPKSPDEVVGMLNSFYETAERTWTRHPFVKTKFTADEIMIVFPSVETACLTAIEIKGQLGPMLRPYGLGVGGGIHFGHVVEGLLGSSDVKLYDVIGDTVNTAKRICDKAGEGVILVSQDVRDAIGTKVVMGGRQELSVKGKAEPLVVYSLDGMAG